MRTLLLNKPEAALKSREQMLFLSRWVKNPLKMGSVAPSSKFLAKAMAEVALQHPSDIVVELGGGTGSFTEALLRAGVSEKNLYVVEIDPKLCQYLKVRFPHLAIIQGDAQNLQQVLPASIQGKIGSIISGMPFLSMPSKVRHAILESCLHVLKPGGNFVQFTYGLKSSLPDQELGLNKERMGYIFRNFPPATVWRYWK